uniref:Putative transcriptional regulator n=1 Tax=termite gut metagenome TaxID=433724 RepID=S0DEB6_9ZZZZ
MINILLKDNDQFYLQGITQLIVEVLTGKYQSSYRLLHGFTTENIKEADITVMALAHGERQLCVPELRDRTKGIVIGVLDKASRHQRVLPLCFSDCLFIERQLSIEEVSLRLNQRLDKYFSQTVEEKKQSCYGCIHQRLSPKQSLIMANMFYGKSIVQIAHELNVSDKTIFTHKYLVMKKFNLENDYELQRFMQVLARKSVNPSVFRDCLASIALCGSSSLPDSSTDSAFIEA